MKYNVMYNLTVCPWIFSAAPSEQINVCVSSKTIFDLSLPSKTAITTLLIFSVLSHAVVMIDDTSYFIVVIVSIWWTINIAS